MAIMWPDKMLKPQAINVDLSHRSLRGPSAASGFTQVVSNSAGIWKVTFSQVPVTNPAKVRLWRMIDAQSQGMLNPISIPIYEEGRNLFAMNSTGTNIHRNNVLHADQTYFNDGTTYLSGFMSASAQNAQNVGRTGLQITKHADFTLVPGLRFSINDKLYQIASVSSQSSNFATVQIYPPLREAVQKGERIEFDHPRIRVRLASDNEMRLTLSANQMSFPTINFIEDL